MKASHKEIWIPVKTGIGFTQVQIMPGQFIFGRHEAAKELKMKPGSVRNRMEKLKNIGNLDIKPDKHFSLISVINWDSYQSYINEIGQPTGQPPDNHRTTTGHKQELKNDKNVKKEDKNIYGEFKNVKLLEEEYQKLSQRFGEIKAKAMIENLSQALASKVGYDKKYKDHYATILSWERKNPLEVKYGTDPNTRHDPNKPPSDPIERRLWEIDQRRIIKEGRANAAKENSTPTPSVS